jgi:mycothiol synthase
VESETVRAGLRAYQGAEDLERILRVVGEWNAQTDCCGYYHAGDISHFVTNGMRKHNPSEHLFYVEANGEIEAIILIMPPKRGGFEVMVHPQRRGGELERELTKWAERETWARIEAAGVEKDTVSSDTMDCDTIKANLLRERGYEVGQPFMIYTERSLSEPIPDSVLPEGFTIRSVEGLHESEALGEVHSSAFNSNWQPGEYLRVMQSTGFHIDRELVVVAPDGRLAAFLIYWIDPYSKSGLFEPVGCHQDFQRRGLTRALMYEGMRRMKAHGMEIARVLHEVAEENPASAALYASVGFQPKYQILECRKQMR